MWHCFEEGFKQLQQQMQIGWKTERCNFSRRVQEVLVAPSFHSFFLSASHMHWFFLLVFTCSKFSSWISLRSEKTWTVIVGSWEGAEICLSKPFRIMQPVLTRKFRCKDFVSHMRCGLVIYITGFVCLHQECVSERKSLSQSYSLTQGSMFCLRFLLNQHTDMAFPP